MTAFVHVALALRLKIKIMWEPSLVLQVYVLVSSHFTASFREIQDCVMEEERAWRYRRFAIFFKTLFCNRWSQLMYLYHVLFAYFFHKDGPKGLAAYIPSVGVESTEDNQKIKNYIVLLKFNRKNPS